MRVSCRNCRGSSTRGGGGFWQSDIMFVVCISVSAAVPLLGCPACLRAAMEALWPLCVGQRAWGSAAAAAAQGLLCPETRSSLSLKISTDFAQYGHLLQPQSSHNIHGYTDCN